MTSGGKGGVDSREVLKLTGDGWSSEYKSVDKLLKYLGRKTKSEASRKSYLHHVTSLCRRVEKTPDELVELARGTVEELVQSYADSYNNGEYSKRTANAAIATLKTFFEVNGFSGRESLDLESYHVPTRYRKSKEKIPRKPEVYRMADSAEKLRDRAIILTLYSTGLRVSSLRALRYSDVKEELLEGISNIKIPVYPEMKKVVPNACKRRIPHYKFTCDEATEAIRCYIGERKEKYGEPGGDDPLFASEYNQVERGERNSKNLSSKQVQRAVKGSARKAAVPGWKNVTPTCLRKAFETVLHSETCDGGRLDPKIQEFFMGHILPNSQDHYFDRSRVEKLRAEYSRLKFGRVVVENKFKKLRRAVTEAFEGTGEDPEELMEEYLRRKRKIREEL